MRSLLARFGKTKRLWQNLFTVGLFILLFSINSTAHDAGVSSVNVTLNNNQLIIYSTYARNDFRTKKINNLVQEAFLIKANGDILTPTKVDFAANGHEIVFRHILGNVSVANITIQSLLPPSLSSNHKQILTISRDDGKEIVNRTLQGNYQFSVQTKELYSPNNFNFTPLFLIISLGICLFLGKRLFNLTESIKMTKVALTFANIGILILIIAYSFYNQNNRSVQANADESKVRIYEKDGKRYIESNGIPNHKTGKFPNQGNPNKIRKQEHRFKVPLNPKISPNRIQMPMPPPPRNRHRRLRGERGERHRPPPPRNGRRGGPMLFGVALNGIPFDPGTGEAWNNDPRSGWNNEALTGKTNLGVDINNAHVQPTGAYHYHGIPTGLIENLIGKKTNEKMLLIGYAADGFPVYSQYGYAKSNDAKSKLKNMTTSYRLKKGTRPDGPGGKYDGTYLQDFEYVESLGDLDQCNGRTGVTPEFPKGIYHYFITDKFPFIARCHKAIPDESFRKTPPPGRRGFGRPPG